MIKVGNMTFDGEVMPVHVDHSLLTLYCRPSGVCIDKEMGRYEKREKARMLVENVSALAKATEKRLALNAVLVEGQAVKRSRL